MKQAREKAILCVLSNIFFTLTAYVMMRLEIYVPVLFSVLGAMLCTAACFTYGKEYQLMHWIECMAGIFAEEKDGDRKQCKNCGCPEFYIVAGRAVCLCCGTVAEDE